MIIGIIAPPWLPVPPRRYGGTEVMIDGLARGLKQLGHEVILVCSRSSTCPVTRIPIGTGPHPHAFMGNAMIEIPYVLRAYEALADHDVDIIHDHTAEGFLVAKTQKMGKYGCFRSTPVVTTNHNLFDVDRQVIFKEAATRGIPVIAISENHAGTALPGTVAKIIHHGIDVDQFPQGPGGGGYLFTLGRMSPVKGIREAIMIAQEADMPLKIAARMQEPGERQYFDQEIRPLLDDGKIEYLGEASFREKTELLGNAEALVNPINWAEPFGLAMIESLACGTPVLSTRLGSVPEIITDGETGYLGESFRDLVLGVEVVKQLDRDHCRREVEARFSIQHMAWDHADLYAKVIEYDDLD